jgi:hypothetical protein
MGLAHSPRIVADGLVFYYDMGNSLKSWKGAPTTNLYVDGDFSSRTLHPVRSGTWAFIDDPRNSFKTVLRALPSGSTQYHGRDIPVVVSTVYSLQMEVYVSVDFNGTNVQMYPEQGGSGANRSYDLSKKGTWQTLKFDGKAATTTNIRMLAYVLSAFTTGYVLISNVQVEQQSFATPFVNGTRSNTQAILDLTNNNTLTANSGITYLTNGTFEFLPANSNSTLTLPLSTGLNKLTGTINTWVYPRGYSSSNGIFVNRENSTANALDWLWIGSWSSGSIFYFRLGNGSDCCSQDLTVSNWSTVCPVNTWSNVSVTWQSGIFSRIYVNGILINSRTITSIPNTNPSSTGRIGLGHDSSGTGSWNGVISNFSIFNRALTSQEIAQNFNALRGRFGI